MRNINVEIARNLAMDGYDIWITAEAVDGSVGLAKPILLDFQEAQPGVYEQPTLRLGRKEAEDFLSSFATALATAGFKSDELKNTQNQISAMAYHLEDMRKLVFKLK